MRAAIVLAALLIGLSAQQGRSQDQDAETNGEAPAQVVSPILTLDDERLFTGSAFGKAVIARQEANAQALTEENRRIEAALEAEEKDLTSRRAVMSREEFLPLSDAFNQKVEGIRKAQGAKERELNRTFDENRQRFLQAARPVLAEVMRESGAVAIIDRRAVIEGLQNIDVTDAAIARLDAAFAEGSLALTSP